MKHLSETINPYCTLWGGHADCGGATMPVLAEIFRSVIEDLNRAVVVNPWRFLHIQPDLGWGHPQCSKSGRNYTIYLFARGNYWGKYIYQFALRSNEMRDCFGTKKFRDASLQHETVIVRNVR